MEKPLRLICCFLFILLSNYGYCQEWRYHKIKGGEYFSESNYKKAIEHYNKALHFKPDLIDALRMRAACKLLSNDYKGALIDYDKLIKNEPNNDQLYFNRAICKTNLKMIESACIDFNMAKKLGHKEAIERIKKHCKT